MVKTQVLKTYEVLYICIIYMYAYMHFKKTCIYRVYKGKCYVILSPFI